MSTPKTTTEWQPIETAPKDGRQIILTNGVTVAQGWWLHEDPYVRDQRDPAGVYLDQQEHDGFDGWMDCEGGMQPDPTHWMPLPPAPGATPAAQAAQPPMVSGRAALVEAWGALPDDLRTSPALEPLYRAIQACDDFDEDGWPKLDRPAKVGNGSFGRGVSARLVVDCAQRLHEMHAAEAVKTREQHAIDERNRRMLWDMLNGGPPPGCEKAAQPADVARLVEALERIQSLSMSQFMAPYDMAMECVNIARAALAAKGADHG